MHTFSVSNLLSMIVLRNARPNLYAFLSSSKNTSSRHVISLVISAITTATTTTTTNKTKKKQKQITIKIHVKVELANHLFGLNSLAFLSKGTKMM